MELSSLLSSNFLIFFNFMSVIICVCTCVCITDLVIVAQNGVAERGKVVIIIS